MTNENGKVPGIEEIFIIISSLFNIIKDVQSDFKNTNDPSNIPNGETNRLTDKKKDENNHLIDIDNVNNSNIRDGKPQVTVTNSASNDLNQELKKIVGGDIEDSTGIEQDEIHLTTREIFFSSELKKVRQLKKLLSQISLFFKSGTVSLHESRSIFVYFLAEVLVSHANHITNNFYLWNFVIEVINNILLHWKRQELQYRETISPSRDSESSCSNSRNQDKNANFDTVCENLDSNDKDIFIQDQNLEFKRVDARLLGNFDTLSEQVDFIDAIIQDSTPIDIHHRWNKQSHRYSSTGSICDYQARLWNHLRRAISIRLSSDITSYNNRVFFHCLRSNLDDILNSVINIIVSLCAKEDANNQDHYELASVRETCLRNLLVLLFILQHFFDSSNYLYSYYIELSMFNCINVFVQWLFFHLSPSSDPTFDMKARCGILMGRIMLRLVENHGLALSWLISSEAGKILRLKVLSIKSESLIIVLSSLYRYCKKYSETYAELQTRRSMNAVGVVYRYSHFAIRFKPDSWLQNDSLPQESEHQQLCEKQLKRLTEYLDEEELLFEARNELFVPATDPLHSESDDEFPLWGFERIKNQISLKSKNLSQNVKLKT